MCRICGIGVLVFNEVYIGIRIKIAVGNKRQTVDVSMERLVRELNASEIEYLCNTCKKVLIKRTKTGNYITDIELYRNVRIKELTNTASIKRVCGQIREEIINRNRNLEGVCSRC